MLFNAFYLPFAYLTCILFHTCLLLFHSGSRHFNDARVNGGRECDTLKVGQCIYTCICTSMCIYTYMHPSIHPASQPSIHPLYLGLPRHNNHPWALSYSAQPRHSSAGLLTGGFALWPPGLCQATVAFVWDWPRGTGTLEVAASQRK